MTTSEIVKRLREAVGDYDPDWGAARDAADRLEAQEAENKRLREALQAVRDEIVYGGGDIVEGPNIDKLHDIARAALKGET